LIQYAFQVPERKPSLQPWRWHLSSFPVIVYIRTACDNNQIMTHPPYSKAAFEADLLALGKVRHLPPQELHRIDEQPGRHAVLTNALGHNAVVLFQEQPKHNFDEAVRTGNASRPLAYNLDDKGIHVVAPKHALQLPNPYGLTAYFPAADNDKGDAAFYIMEDVMVPLEDVSRYITEQEASQLIIDTAIPLADGLFFSRPEAEASHHAYYLGKSMTPPGVEHHAHTQAPSVTASVDPRTTEGSFKISGSTPVTRSSIMSHLSYTGPAAITGKLGDIPVYARSEDRGLKQLSGILPGKVTFTVDNTGLFNYSYTDSTPWSFDDLLRMIRSKTLAKQPIPDFTQSRFLDKALERGLVNHDSLAYTPARATQILFNALTQGPDTPYFQELRRELGPAFDHESALVAQARTAAHDQWRAILAGEGRLEPVAQGLEEVANAAGIRRAMGIVAIRNGNYVYAVTNGNIIIL
jgi:hypothetical protein